MCNFGQVVMCKTIINELLKTKGAATLLAIAVAILLSVTLIWQKISYENGPAAQAFDQGLDSKKFENASELIATYSNQLSSYALAALGGSAFLLMSNGAIAAFWQRLTLIVCLCLFLISLFFSTIVADLNIRSAVLGNGVFLFDSLQSAIRWQEMALFGGVVFLMIIVAAMAWSEKW